MPEDVVGKYLLDALPGHRNTPIFAAYLDVARTGKTRVMEEVSARDILSRHVWLRLVVVSMGEDIAVLAQDITERRKVEAELLEAKQRAQESEERTRFILKHNPNAIAVFDHDMNILMTSDRFLRDYNVRDEDVVGRNHYEVFPEIPERWREVHRRSLQGEVLRNDDDCFVRPDGSTTYTRWECRPWYHSDNQIGGMVAYTEVITERKQTEEALRTSVARYDELVSRIPVGIYVLWRRADGRKEFEYVSDRWCAIHGLRREDVLADVSVVDELVHPDDRERFIEQNRESAREETPFLWEGRFFTGDGTLVHLRIESTPDFFENGDTRWFGVIQDITERKRIEDELRQQKEYLERTLETTPDGFWIIAPDKRITNVNAAYCRMSGYSRGELTGMQISDIEAVESPRETAERMKRVSENGYETFETKHRRKDGSLLEIEVSVSHLDRADGDYLVVFCRDITQRKRDEQRLRDSQAMNRALFDQALGAVYISDISGRFIDVNNGACRRSGYSREELLEMSVFDLNAPDADRLQARNGGLLDTWKHWVPGHQHTREAVHVGKDGRRYSVLIST